MAAEVSDLSELDIIFLLKEEERIARKAFLGGKDISASLPTGLGRSLGKHIVARHNMVVEV